LENEPLSRLGRVTSAKSVVIAMSIYTIDDMSLMTDHLTLFLTYLLVIFS